jgi:hypothetical protein
VIVIHIGQRHQIVDCAAEAPGPRLDCSPVVASDAIVIVGVKRTGSSVGAIYRLSAIT